MKEYLRDKFKNLPPAAHMPLFIAGLLLLTIIITTSKSTRQEKTIYASSKNNTSYEVVTPTIYCLGTCPTITPPSPTSSPITPTYSIAPTTTPTPPTTNPPLPTGIEQTPMPTPTPTTDPCITIAPANTNSEAQGFLDGFIKNLIKKIMDFIFQLLQQIFEMIRRLLERIKTPTPTPTPTPIPAPTQPTISQPVISQPINSSITPAPSRPQCPTPIPTDDPKGINIKEVSHWGYGPAYAVKAIGNYLYYGEGTVFIIRDITDPMISSKLSDLDLKETINSIDINGNHAYVGLNGSFMILDISDKNNPKIIGAALPADHKEVLKSSYSAKGIKVIGDYAYIAADGYGFVIYNITDKNSPKEVGWLQLDTPQSIDAQSNFAYIGGYRGTVKIVDISNPSSPSEISTWTIPSDKTCKAQISGVKVRDNYAYVAQYGYGFYSLNISNPASPSQIGYIGSSICSEEANSIELVGNTAYISWWYKGLVAVDVSNPANMKMREIPSTIDTFYTLIGYNYGLSINGNYAYMAGHYKNIGIFDISNPPNERISKIIEPMFGRVHGVIENGNYLYLAQDYYLVTLDISNVTRPAYLNEQIYGGRGGGMAINGNHLYQGAGWGNNPLAIYDVSNPAKPIITKKSASNVQDDVNYSNGFLHGSSNNIYQVVDVSDLNNIKTLGSYTASKLYGFKTVGQYAYLVDNDQFKIFDISDPNNVNPTGSTTITKPTYWSHIEIIGNYAYTNGGYNSLQIIDISNKSAPKKVNEVTLEGIGGLSGSISSYGNYLAASGYKTTKIYNAGADPTRLPVEGEYNFTGLLKLSDRYLYVFKGYDGPGVTIYSHTLKNK